MKPNSGGERPGTSMQRTVPHAAAGLNIEGLCLVTSGGRGIIHLAVNDAATAECVLESAGIRIAKVSDIYVLHKDEKRVTGRPGSFGGICRALADNGITLDFGYPAENNRFVLGVTDVDGARALSG